MRKNRNGSYCVSLERTTGDDQAHRELVPL
jgi:hypothetical protein